MLYSFVSLEDSERMEIKSRIKIKICFGNFSLNMAVHSYALSWQ